MPGQTSEYLVGAGQLRRCPLCGCTRRFCCGTTLPHRSHCSSGSAWQYRQKRLPGAAAFSHSCAGWILKVQRSPATVMIVVLVQRAAQARVTIVLTQQLLQHINRTPVPITLISVFLIGILSSPTSAPTDDPPGARPIQWHQHRSSAFFQPFNADHEM